jgi:hypothetical protein
MGQVWHGPALADVRQARIRKTAPLQVADETPQQVIVRRRYDGDHLSQLGRAEGPYRPARLRGQGGEGHDRALLDDRDQAL